MKQLNNKVAVVTGAGSGIGRATAIELGKEGCLLAISDIDSEGLEATRQLLEKQGTRVHAALLDVSNKQAFYDYADTVIKEFDKVNIVINNAGVALGAKIENTQYEDFEWLMNINFWGMVYGTKAFLPHLKQTGDGHICNVSSVLGFIAIPNTGAYNASKFAIRGFNESLRAELAIEDCGVSISSIHPGGIKTNIARDSRVDQSTLNDMGINQSGQHQWFTNLAITTPETAAKTIVKGIKKNKIQIIIGIDAYIMNWVNRFAPILLYKLMTKLMKMGLKRTQKNPNKEH